MPQTYEVFERGTGRKLGRGTWREVQAARIDAARAGVAADVRRVGVTAGDREALYQAARNPMLARIVGGK